MEERIAQDTLFIACTRPPMWAGVPLQAAMGNVCAVMIVFILLKNPLYLSIGLVTHWAMRLIVAHDYNMFGIWGLWFATKGRALDVGRWGGSTVSPLPLQRARRAREIRFYV